MNTTKKSTSSILAMAVFSMIGASSVIYSTDAEAKRMGSRSSSFSRSSTTTPKPTTLKKSTQPSPASTPAQPSMIGSNLGTPALAGASSMARALPARGLTSTRPLTSTPEQRSSMGSMVAPLLLGAGVGIGAGMLYDYLTNPDETSITTSEPGSNTIPTNDGRLNIIKPNASFKIFAGANIPAEFQEKMKANDVSIEAKQGTIQEYSKTIKTHDGMEIKVDVADLPVLVIYEKEKGKPTYDLYVPL